MAASPNAGRTSLSRRASCSAAAGRRSSVGSVGSVKSLITGREERVRGVKRGVGGRGAWVNGMVGFGREWARGVWGRSGFQEWNRVRGRYSRFFVSLG